MTSFFLEKSQAGCRRNTQRTNTQHVGRPKKKLYKNDGIARPGTRQPRKTRKSVTHGNRKNRHGYEKIKTAMRIYPDMESPPVRDMNDVKLAVVDFGDADGEPLWPHRHHQQRHTHYLLCHTENLLRGGTPRHHAHKRTPPPQEAGIGHSCGGRVRPSLTRGDGEEFTCAPVPSWASCAWRVHDQGRDVGRRDPVGRLP